MHVSIHQALQPGRFDKLLDKVGVLSADNFCDLMLRTHIKYGLHTNLCFIFVLSCHPSVIVNGDMWTNNLIFVKDTDTGKVGDELCAIIDWQFAHGGCCVEDLCVLLAWALSP